MGVWGRPDGIGGSDDPDYIQRMYDFITDKSNNVAYASYFEYDYPSDSDGGKHSLEDSFPNSAAKFKQLFVPLYTKALLVGHQVAQSSAPGGLRSFRTFVKQS